MSTLKATLETLASAFSQQVLSALQGASLADIAQLAGAQAPSRAPRAVKAPKAATGEDPAPALRRGGKRVRRTAADLEITIGKIVALLSKNPDGLRSEDIRTRLGLQAKDMPKPLALAISSKQVKKKGAKRATTYFAAKG